jgi:hypothetical protein
MAVRALGSSGEPGERKTECTMGGMDSGADSEAADRLSDAARHDSHSSSEEPAEEPHPHFRLSRNGKAEGQGSAPLLRLAGVRSGAGWADTAARFTGRLTTVRMAAKLSHSP